MWETGGFPTRSGYEEAARAVLQWRRAKGIQWLGDTSTVMVTATLDDGWGNGIQLIRRFAEAAGVRVIDLGLLQSADQIVDACRNELPDILGLTILQFDTEEALTSICRRTPPETAVIAGGPVFSADPAMASRAGVHYVARNAADFWKFLISRY